MKRTAIINSIIQATGAKSYLEVGVGQTGNNLRQVVCETKHSCDIKEPSTYQMESRTMWDSLDRKYDIIFVDGAHDYETSRMDMVEALKRAKLVICHDVYPDTEQHALPVKPSHSAPWCGEVYRAFASVLRKKGVDGCAVADDHGVGVLWTDPKAKGNNRGRLPGYEALKAEPEKHINLTTIDDLMSMAVEEYGRA